MAAVCVLAAGGCGLIGQNSGSYAPLGRGGAPNTSTTVIPLAEAGTKPTERSGYGASGCETVARGPWTDVRHRPDPRGILRRGGVRGLPQHSNTPAGLNGMNDDPPGGLPGEAPDTIVDFGAVEDHRDPNTLASPGSLREAWRRLHYRGATSANWNQSHDHQTVSVTQFGSAAEAKRALTAHLTELCPYANSTTRLPGGNGVYLVKETGSTRVLFVLDDVEVSVYACPCTFEGGGPAVADFDTWWLQVAQALSPGATKPAKT